MNIETRKCKQCKYELENNLPISYDQFTKDFEIENVSGDTLTGYGSAICKICRFKVNFIHECLIYEKLYLISKE